jgi:hypothetical protein
VALVTVMFLVAAVSGLVIAFAGPLTMALG